MKITIEELKGLNIEAYLDQQAKIVEKMHLAYILIPVRTRELYELIHNQSLWYMYFEQLKPYKANSPWYEKYKELVKKRENKLKNEIGSLYNDLDGVVVLADRENIIKVTKEYINSAKTEEPSLLSLLPARTDQPFTYEKYKELKELKKNTRNYFEGAWQFTTTSLNYKYAETIDFVHIINSIDSLQEIFRTYLDFDLDKFKRMQKINANTVSNVLKEATEKEFKYLDQVSKASIVREYFYNIEVVTEFASLAYYSRVANNNIPANTFGNSPLKWIGKPAQLGYFMYLLSDLGYIDAPKKRNGEINYSEFARQVARAFQFNGDNESYLAKSLNPESNNMEIGNKDKIKIPHIKEIS